MNRQFLHLHNVKKKYIIQSGEPDSRIPRGSRERYTNFLLNIKKILKCITKIKKKI